MAACSGLAWAGMVYGACNQELLHKLLDRGFSNDEILQMCGHPVEVPPTPSRPPDRPPADSRESQESNKEVPNHAESSSRPTACRRHGSLKREKKGRGLLSVSRKISKITSKSIRRMILVVP